MTKRILVVFVILVLSLGSLGNRVVNRTGGGGGGGTTVWVDSLLVAAIDSGYSPGTNEALGTAALTATQTGNVLKLRAYNRTGTSTLLKLALVEPTTFNVLTWGSTSGPSGVGWVEVTCTSYAVTASNTYHVVMMAGAGDFNLGYQASQPSGSGYYSSGVYTYAGFPPANFISLTADTSRIAAGYEITY